MIILMNVKPVLLSITFTVAYAGHSLEDFKPDFGPDDDIECPHICFHI